MRRRPVTSSIHLSVAGAPSARHVACGYLYGANLIRATVSRQLVNCGRCLRVIARREPRAA